MRVIAVDDHGQLADHAGRGARAASVASCRIRLEPVVGLRGARQEVAQAMVLGIEAPADRAEPWDVSGSPVESATTSALLRAARRTKRVTLAGSSRPTACERDAVSGMLEAIVDREELRQERLAETSRPPAPTTTAASVRARGRDPPRTRTCRSCASAATTDCAEAMEMTPDEFMSVHSAPNPVRGHPGPRDRRGRVGRRDRRELLGGREAALGHGLRRITSRFPGAAAGSPG